MGVGYDFPESSLYINPASLINKKDTYLKSGSYPVVFGLARKNFFEIITSRDKIPLALSLSMVNFGEGELDGYTWQDNHLALSSAFRTGKKTTTGITFSYYFLSISEVGDDIKRNARGMSLSYGNMYYVKDTLQYGWVLNNLFSRKEYSSGTKERDEVELTLGASYRALPLITILVDIYNLIDFDTSYFIPNTTPTIVLGLEKKISEEVVLRGSISTKNKREASIGATIKSDQIELNYLYFVTSKIPAISVPRHRILLGLKIN